MSPGWIGIRTIWESSWSEAGPRKTDLLAIRGSAKRLDFPRDARSRSPPREGSPSMRFFIALLFFALAGWFAFGDRSSSMPDDLGGSAAAAVDLSWLDPLALREVMADPPTARIAGLDMRCSECHSLFDSRRERQFDRQQHTHLVHDHGLNDRCFNCHAYHDHNQLALYDDEMVGFEESTQLCAKCHGPTWRDWEQGMHGRTAGTWRSGDERRVRLVCVQCHDPHAPAFPPMEPLPGPDTLRMRATLPCPDHVPGLAVRDPLAVSEGADR